MSISNYLEAKLLDAVFNHQPYACSGDVYVSLHSADPGETGVTSEISGGSYARKQVSFEVASSPGGTIQNDTHAYWTNMPAETITYIGIWDAVTSGNHLWSGALTTSKVVNGGDSFELATGDIDVTLA